MISKPLALQHDVYPRTAGRGKLRLPPFSEIRLRSLDDLRYAHALEGASGQLTPEQSETLARAFSQSAENTVATKLDIAELKTDIANLKVDMIRWIVGAIAFNLLGTIGIMLTVAELARKAE